MTDKPYSFEYQPATIHHGSGVVDDLEAELEQHSLANALIVTDDTLSSVEPVIEPVKNGLGSALAGVFDDVTPEKYLREAYTGAQLVETEDIDALLPIGGGSSIDTAKLISLLASHERPLDEVASETIESEKVTYPEADQELLDIFVIPTTLPGADLSQVAGVNLSLDPGDQSKLDIPSTGVSDRRLMPTAVFFDLDLFETTPQSVLARSAMNGFDKGIEMVYTRYHNPLTDGTAVRGSRLLYETLPALRSDSMSERELSQIIKGITAAQYGLSTPNGYRASIIHAFGHAIARNYQVQQGVAHAVIAPHVLQYLFEQVDGRRELLAEAFDIDTANRTDDETASAIVEAVESTRDALELPSELRSLGEIERSHFPELAKHVIEDPFMEVAPRDLNATQDEIEGVFEAMW